MASFLRIVAVVVNEHTGARREAEIAMVVAGLGAIAIIVGAAFGLGLVGGQGTGRNERISYMAGGFLIGLGCLLLLLAIHGGYGSPSIH